MFTAVHPKATLEELLDPATAFPPPTLKVITLADAIADPLDEMLDDSAVEQIKQLPTWRIGDPDVTIVHLNGSYGVEFLSPHARTRVLLAWNMNLRAGWCETSPTGSLCLVATKRELELIRLWCAGEEMKLEFCGEYDG
jgi:hypothetical protein